jgi:RNA polymerase sigma-70 factor (ECF subfamily)
MITAGEALLERGLETLGEDEDHRLWRAVAAGDTRAFERLVERHSPRVTSVASRFLDNREDVADAVQETFLRAWEHRRRFRGEAGVRAWLLAITVNVCRNRRRGYWRWRLFLSRDAASLCAAPDDPQVLAEERLGHGVLDSAVRELPEPLRTPFVLRFYEELSGVEIAAILHCRESTVWSRIYAARRELRKKLGG